MAAASALGAVVGVAARCPRPGTGTRPVGPCCRRPERSSLDGWCSALATRCPWVRPSPCLQRRAVHPRCADPRARAWPGQRLGPARSRTRGGNRPPPLGLAAGDHSCCSDHPLLRQNLAILWTTSPAWAKKATLSAMRAPPASWTTFEPAGRFGQLVDAEARRRGSSASVSWWSWATGRPGSASPTSG